MATLSVPTQRILLTNVRRFLNSIDSTNSFWSDDELNSYINEAIRLYFLECVTNDEGYFTVQTGTSIPDLDIVANQETVALPTDCFIIKNVWKKLSNGWAILAYHNSLTEGYTSQGGSSADGFFPTYYFQGTNLVFRPTPNFSQVGGIRLEYIQLPDQMIWGGDSLSANVSPIFKQLLEMYAVYKAKLRESLVNGGTAYTIVQQHVQELYNTFKQNLARRSKYPTSIQAYSPETD